tara:strand:+ start:570 stop:1082 length:513 start_codon:yes stop_codon:yes gene_type:complete
MIKIFLCFAISISFAQDNANSNNSKSKYINVQIEGMHCAAGCAKSIERKLNNTEGLVAMVNFTNSKALIEYDTQLFSDFDVVDIINNYQGGKFKASLLGVKKSTCSKGKQCCQKTGKSNPACDNKSKGCCAGSSKACASSKKKSKQTNSSLANMIPGHSGCQKPCCASKK